ncbi:flavodoxin family protein [uncultured Thomasclavelia sp.]|uniref:flavodoxin family protein n=1 Tax=uncultured Thomasclavelia sp. TaxID=3025759 RepID=UPI0025EBE156|nr:NAD(P)H-dependent oxidoreductase [uncultured Thomasclavelia sp.]
MKVIAINGSSRLNGNTMILINEIFKQLNQAGIETELIPLANKKINPCRACFNCHQNPIVFLIMMILMKYLIR